MSKPSSPLAVLDWCLILAAAALWSAPAWAAEEPPDWKTGEAAILAALNEKTSLDFVDQPLSDVLAFFEDVHRVEIEVDTRALDDAGIGADAPISRTLRNLTFRSALNLLLRDLHLTWTIRDEVLLITTPEEAEMVLLTRIYDVGDLATIHDPDGKPWTDFESLIQLITGTIEPETWDHVGGPASVAPLEYRGAKVLVIRQTILIHEQVAGLFDALRNVADKHGDDVFPVRERGRAIGSAHPKTPTAFFDPAPASP